MFAIRPPGAALRRTQVVPFAVRYVVYQRIYAGGRGLPSTCEISDLWSDLRRPSRFPSELWLVLVYKMGSGRTWPAHALSATKSSWAGPQEKLYKPTGTSVLKPERAGTGRIQRRELRRMGRNTLAAPGLVDAHIHPDKSSWRGPWLSRQPARTLREFIANDLQAQRSYTRNVEERAFGLLKTALQNGTLANGRRKLRRQLDQKHRDTPSKNKKA